MFELPRERQNNPAPLITGCGSGWDGTALGTGETGSGREALGILSADGAQIMARYDGAGGQCSGGAMGQVERELSACTDLETHAYDLVSFIAR